MLQPKEASSPFLRRSEACAFLHSALTLAKMSSVLDVFIARALSNVLRDTPVISLAVNPGLCRTAILNNFVGAQAVFLELVLRIAGRTAEEGGRQLTWAAVGRFDNTDDLRGALLDSQAIFEASDRCLGEQGKRRQSLIWVSVVRLQFDKLFI